MATSGTVARTTITTGQVIDHAFRRCRLASQQVTSEHLDIARRLLWMQLSSLNTRGVALWLIDTQLVGLNEGVANIPTTAGNLDLLNSNLRQIQRIDGTPASSGGSAGNAYDQDLTTACVEAVPNGSITINFTSTDPVPLTQVGVYPAATGIWTFSIQYTIDGSTWVTYQTNTAINVSAARWLWYDIDGVPECRGVRIQASGGTTLAVYEIVCGNNPADIPMGVMDRDTWTQLPNKSFPSRPTQYYWDRRLSVPIYHIWPAPSAAYTLTWLIVNYVERQVQDVGTLPQQIEVPDRWYLPIIAELAKNCAFEIKEVDPAIIPTLKAEADELMTKAWDGEGDGSPARFMPNIAVYTR